MTNRFRYPTDWASGGTAIDPDLDTTNPSYVPDKYETIGWGVQKPPEYWQNFLQQISDQKIMQLLASGVVEFDGSVLYVPNAITKVGDVFYINTSNTATNADPLSGSPWFPVLSIVGSEYNTFVVNLNSTIAGHLAADNPHKDTIEGIGGYNKDTVFTAVDSDANPLNIKYHTKQEGRVHSETVAQVGTISTSGGTFTGDITFASKIALNVGKTSYIWLNQGTGRVELVVGVYSLSVDSAGNSIFISPSGNNTIVTEANFESIQIKLNGQFALPAKLYSINLNGSLSDARSIGLWTISTVNVPVFDKDIGLKYDNNAATLSNVTINVSATIHIIAGNTSGVAIGTTEVGSGHTINDISTLVARIGSGLTNVSSIDIYPTLSTYQKSMLVQ